MLRIGLDGDLDLTGFVRRIRAQLHLVSGLFCQIELLGLDFLVINKQPRVHIFARETGRIDVCDHRQLALDRHRRWIGLDGGHGDIPLANVGRRLAQAEGMNRARKPAQSAGFCEGGKAHAIVRSVAEDQKAAQIPVGAMAFVHRVQHSAEIGARTIRLASGHNPIFRNGVLGKAIDDDVNALLIVELLHDRLRLTKDAEHRLPARTGAGFVLDAHAFRSVQDDQQSRRHAQLFPIGQRRPQDHQDC